MEKLTYIDLFCGIGGFRIAAEKVCTENNILPFCKLSCDIDDYAKKSYHANFGDIPHDDIKKISEDVIPDHDILFAGFPCQPFSIIGLGKGFGDNRGTLFFDIVRILQRKRPKAFILENVKQLISHHRGETIKNIVMALKDLGYYVEYRVLNALDYGLPQKRERIFIVGYHRNINFQWPFKSLKMKPLDEILEKNVNAKYFASEYIRNKRQETHNPIVTPSIWHENKSGNICSYPYSCALRAGASYNYLLVNGERRLTPREMLRLQGFPDWYKIVVPYAQIRKQAGNAVPVNLVYAVFNSLIKFLKEDILKDREKTYGTSGIPALAEC
ncbi:MAG: DNA (cytosine-5-)-methyltransferase [Candidatus Auribacterota bacterium]